MDELDLVFQGEPLTGPSYDLVFGETDTPSVPDADVTLDAQHPPATVVVAVGTVTDVSVAAIHPEPTISVIAKYTSGAQRPVVAKIEADWQVAVPVEEGATHRSSEAVLRPAGVETHWQPANKLAVSMRVLQPHGLVKNRGSWSARHQNAVPVGRMVRSRYGDTVRDNRLARTSGWQNGIPVRTHRQTRWQNHLHDRRQQVTTWWGEAVPIEVGVRDRAGRGLDVVVGVQSWWGEAIRPPPGFTVIVVPPKPPGPTCYTPPPGDAVALLFKKQWDGSTDLVFVCEREEPPEPGATVVVPVKDTYMVFNDTHLLRVSDGKEIPTNGMSLSLDRDSWTWGFNASIPASLWPELQPDGTGTPQTLALVINGQPYYVLAEGPERDRAFNSASLTFNGRGQSAILSAPYSPERTYNNASFRTARQLMEDVLTWNNVPLGWDVDWRADDWLVPANAWSFIGTYADALNQIAKAAGLYIQPHPMDKKIIVQAKYPVAPWKWNTVTPDFELPSAVVHKEGIQWVKHAEYNGVYVVGVSQGITGVVTREGTAGDLLAPMVVDALITDEPAARQRGLSIIGDTGQQAIISLRLPVLPETGVIPPGKFVRYVDEGVRRVGLVRTTRVEVGFPEVWQTIGVETHGL